MIYSSPVSTLLKESCILNGPTGTDTVPFPAAPRLIFIFIDVLKESKSVSKFFVLSVQITRKRFSSIHIPPPRKFVF